MNSSLPSIESNRLILRLLNVGDLACVLDYHRRNQEHLMPYGPVWPENFLTEEFWSKQIERNLDEFNSDRSLRLFLFDKADRVSIIGNVSFGGILRSAAQFCYLGYGLAKDKQGCGYMTEILPEAFKYVFAELSIHRIMANYMPSNERSGRLLKRLGFVIEGYARDYLCLNGRWEDHILSSLTNPNWQGRV